MWQTFLTGLLGGVVALSGKSLMHLIQSRSKVREERRAWVRSLHSETVDVVADMDLFIRSIRAAAVAGPGAFLSREEIKAKVDEKWEGDLLKRIRRLKFGHPDPDVRDAAEEVEDAAWPYISVASAPRDDPADLLNVDGLERQTALQTIEQAMIEFKRAVYAAPTRKLPKSKGYTGEERPSYLVRAIAEKARKDAGEASATD